MPVLCTAPVASSPRAASLVAAVHDPSNSRSAAAAAAAVPPPPAAAAACSCPPSCLLHRGPLQFLLLNLKLEEMENVESVSLPSNATYCMTVRCAVTSPPQPRPRRLASHEQRSPHHPLPCIDTTDATTNPLQVKNSVGDDVREGVIVDPTETHELDNSRGTAHFCLKWDRAARHQVGQAGRREGGGREGGREVGAAADAAAVTRARCRPRVPLAAHLRTTTTPCARPHPHARPTARPPACRLT